MPTVKLKTTRCSHQQNMDAGHSLKYVDPTAHSVDERLAMGKEVEVAHSLCRKTPSLDDVLDQLQGIHSYVYEGFEATPANCMCQPCLFSLARLAVITIPVVVQTPVTIISLAESSVFFLVRHSIFHNTLSS